jgi:hypothetical protein
LNVKKRQETYEKKENKASEGCGLGQQFAFIKKQGKKYEWTIIYLFFTISNAKNLTCISNNQKYKSKHCCKIKTQISLAV